MNYLFITAISFFISFNDTYTDNFNVLKSRVMFETEEESISLFPPWMS
jgi:hypothetical protein